MRRPLAVVLAVLGIVLAACSSGGDDEGPRGSAGYVAIGDSFVSGPGIGAMDPETPGCLRSEANYAHLLAATMPDLDFRDVSCGGEDTTMLREGRTLPDGTVLEPQLASIGRATTLVTVGIGGNDDLSIAGMFTYCLLPQSATDEQCETFTRTYMPTLFPKIGEHVVSVLADVEDRAPRAEVHLVGYLRFAPDEGQCAALPLTEARREAVVEYEQTMNRTLAGAARRAGVSYVNMYAASQGHDVCSGEPWVNGIQNSPTGDGAFLHPTAAGMQAVVQQLEQVVGS